MRPNQSPEKRTNRPFAADFLFPIGEQLKTNSRQARRGLAELFLASFLSLAAISTLPRKWPPIDAGVLLGCAETGSEGLSLNRVRFQGNVTQAHLRCVKQVSTSEEVLLVGLVLFWARRMGYGLKRGRRK